MPSRIHYLSKSIFRVHYDNPLKLTILALGVFADEAAPAESGAVVDDVADKAEVNENCTDLTIRLVEFSECF